MSEQEAKEGSVEKYRRMREQKRERSGRRGVEYESRSLLENVRDSSCQDGGSVKLTYKLFWLH